MADAAPPPAPNWQTVADTPSQAQQQRSVTDGVPEAIAAFHKLRLERESTPQTAEAAANLLKVASQWYLKAERLAKTTLPEASPEAAPPNEEVPRMVAGKARGDADLAYAQFAARVVRYIEAVQRTNSLAKLSFPSIPDSVSPGLRDALTGELKKLHIPVAQPTDMDVPIVEGRQPAHTSRAATYAEQGLISAKEEIVRILDENDLTPEKVPEQLFDDVQNARGKAILAVAMAEIHGDDWKKSAPVVAKYAAALQLVKQITGLNLKYDLPQAGSIAATVVHAAEVDAAKPKPEFQIDVPPEVQKLFPNAPGSRDGQLFLPEGGTQFAGLDGGVPMFGPEGSAVQPFGNTGAKPDGVQVAGGYGGTPPSRQYRLGNSFPFGTPRGWRDSSGDLIPSRRPPSLDYYERRERRMRGPKRQPSQAPEEDGAAVAGLEGGPEVILNIDGLGATEFGTAPVAGLADPHTDPGHAPLGDKPDTVTVAMDLGTGDPEKGGPEKDGTDDGPDLG